jgi:polysaccharide deacetylase family protein (PEP-CTERM system associated)
MLLQEPPTRSASAPVTGITVPAARHAHLLTVNVEDYFQAGVFHQWISPRNWYRFESRLERNTEETLELLAAHDTRATFFVLGWIAERFPELVRRIHAAGHEVASRGYLHQPLLKVTPAARREDLHRSKSLLEDTLGCEVSGFRLSDGWMRKRDLWFLEELAEAGYRYDSSLLPRHRDFHGQPHRRFIHEQSTAHGSLLEVPLSTHSIAGLWLPIAGGNYLRQLPVDSMRAAVRQWTTHQTSPYVMYFQVWELDAGQPQLSAAGRLSRMRHYRNLGRYRTLLPQYLTDLHFTSVAEHARLQNSPLAALQEPSRRASNRPPVQLTPLRSEAESLRDSAISIRRAPNRAATRTPVTLVIPCFNEEASLPYLHRTLQPLRQLLSAQWDLKVLFVDDCSRDNTHELLTRLFGDDPAIRIVRHEQNRGVSAAILTGITQADTELVASMDCDCSYDPHELARMLPLMKPGVSMVTASPYHREGHVSNVPAWRLTLSHGLSRLYRLLLRKPLATWTSCFRVYRKPHIVDLPLREDGFLGTAEMAAQLSLHNRTIVEHPATLEVRLFGFSKMKTLRTIASHLKLLCRIAGERFGLMNATPGTL